MNETETQIRLRRAKESLAVCRASENELRKKLASAVEASHQAKVKMENLFIQDQAEQVVKIKYASTH